MKSLMENFNFCPVTMPQVEFYCQRDERLQLHVDMLL